MKNDRASEVLFQMEMLSARLLHDLAGVVGSVVNYVECLVDEPGSKSALRSLEEVSEEIVGRFRLLRQAYSFSEDNSSFDKTRDNVKLYLKRKGIARLTWDIRVKMADAESIEKVNKLLSNAILLAVLLMVHGKGISVLVDDVCDGKVRLRISLEADKVEMHQEIRDVLEGKEDCELNTRNMQAYFMSLLLAKYGAHLGHSAGVMQIEIRN